MFRYLLISLTSLLALNVNAAIITHGYLTTNDDGSTNIITDTLNGVEYLRLDVLADLTYAQTLAVLNTQDGGGWSIATSSDAFGFATAILGGSAGCEQWELAANIWAQCGIVGTWADGDLGPNHDELSDWAFYIDDDTPDTAHAFVISSAGHLNTLFMPFDGTDDFSSSGARPDIPVSWLLVRDVSTVPIPAAVWLFGSGLIGLIGIARRKQV